MNTNFYYNKYLKYKNKYLKFKEQNGGMGTTKCPKYRGETVAVLLREYNCLYNQIPKDLLEKFNYKALQDENLDKTKHQITIADLKSRNFPPKFFLGKGYPLVELIKAKYLVFRLIEAGFTYKDIKDAGISLEILNNNGLNVSAEENSKKLKEAGYTIKDFFDTYAKPSEDKLEEEKNKEPTKRLTPLSFYVTKADEKALHALKIIKMAGFTLEEIIKFDKFTKNELLKVFKDKKDEIKEKFKDKEYTLEEILAEIKDKSGNYDSIKFKRININREKNIDLNLIKDHVPFSILYDSNYSLQDLYDSGFLPNQFISLFKERIKTNSYNLTRLKELFTLKELLDNEISLEDILQIGYEPCELKELGISAKSFKEMIQKDKSLLQKLNCYRLKELKEAGYDEKEILKLDFSLEELKSNDYTLERLLEIFTKEDIKDKILEKFSIDEIIENYELKELKKKIFLFKSKLQEYTDISDKLIKKGINIGILYYDFFLNIEDLYKLGFNIYELKDLPNSIIFLRKKGYNLEFFKYNNFNVMELKVKGRYTVKEFKDAGYSVNELKDCFHIIELKDAGYNTLEMIEAEFRPLLLYLIGYDKVDIIIKSVADNYNLVLLSKWVEMAKNSTLSDDERITNIKNILDNKKDIYLKLYFLREHKIPLYLIIAALGNLEDIFDNLKYVFIPDDFVEDEKINPAYYADKFPVNDLLFLDINEKFIVETLSKNKKTKDEIDEEASAMRESYNQDKKIKVERSIIRNNNLQQLLSSSYSLDDIKEALKYYFEEPHMTPLNPWYKSFKKIDDEVYKRENVL